MFCAVDQSAFYGLIWGEMKTNEWGMCVKNGWSRKNYTILSLWLNLQGKREHYD